MLSESVRSEVRVAAHFLVVVRTEGNDVFVGSQKPVAGNRPDTFGRLPSQHGLDLLSNDGAAEYAGKSVTYGDL